MWGLIAGILGGIFTFFWSKVFGTKAERMEKAYQKEKKSRIEAESEADLLKIEGEVKRARLTEQQERQSLDTKKKWKNLKDKMSKP
jgi:hypothetical protein